MAKLEGSRRLHEGVCEITLERRIKQLEEQHGSLRAAARAVAIDPAYLSRLRHGTKTAPSNVILRKLGLRKIIKYERVSDAQLTKLETIANGG